MYCKRIGFLFIFIFSIIIGHSQFRNVPFNLFYASKYKGFLIDKGDSLVEQGYRLIELYQVSVKLNKFQYNKTTNSFRIKGTTLLDNHEFPQIEIYRKKGVKFNEFGILGSSAESDEKNLGRFDIIFKLEDSDSLLFGIPGTYFAEYKLNDILSKLK
jgi:hypothetical protein